MTEKRTVFISGTPYTVTISSEQEVLSAAYAAGGGLLGFWGKKRNGQYWLPSLVYGIKTEAARALPLRTTLWNARRMPMRSFWSGW